VDRRWNQQNGNGECWCNWIRFSSFPPPTPLSPTVLIIAPSPAQTPDHMDDLSLYRGLLRFIVPSFLQNFFEYKTLREKMNAPKLCWCWLSSNFSCQGLAPLPVKAMHCPSSSNGRSLSISLVFLLNFESGLRIARSSSLIARIALIPCSLIPSKF
jgi:hypothetical protein